MKVETRIKLFSTVIFAAFVGAAAVPGAQAQTGAAYGARDPITCTSNNSNSISPESARTLFLCSNEQATGDYLYLITDLNIELGAPRKAIPTSDTYHDIDVNAPVYPIRGSFTRYQCSRQFNLDPSHSNIGTNCNAYPQPKAQGICYRTTFGDWTCKMFDHVTDSGSARMRVPPPK